MSNFPFTVNTSADRFYYFILVFFRTISHQKFM